jgi:hypothetical protein
MRITPYTLLVSFLLFAGCAPRHPKDMRVVDSLRVETEHLLREQALMGYNSWVHGTASNQDSLYRAHRDLFSRDNLNLVTRAVDEEPDSLQRQRLFYFRRYLTLETLGKETAPLTDRYTTYEALASITINGLVIPYRQVAIVLMNETNSARRAALYAAADPVLDSLTLLATEVNAAYYHQAADLGYRSYTDMVEQLKGFSLQQVLQLAKQTLARSDSLYFSLLPEMLKRYTTVDTATFHRYDIGMLFRNPSFDRFFPRRETVGSVQVTYRSLGIDLAAQKNLTIDTTDRPEKNPRAVCFPVDVPEDIRLSIKPTGGVDDYSALYHEMGHAEHYANTAEHAMEFKYLGEPALTETYAFLSEYLLCNPAWLRQHSSMPVLTLKDFVRFQAFYRLYYVRRFCAKVIYEYQLHSGAKNPEQIYASLLSQALGYKQHPSDQKRYLVDVDAHYYAADYLRAWFLEAQLNAWLSKMYGTNWYENTSAGKFLRSLWAMGDRLDVNGLLAAIGEREISSGPWFTTIEEMLRLSAH